MSKITHHQLQTSQWNQKVRRRKSGTRSNQSSNHENFNLNSTRILRCDNLFVCGQPKVILIFSSGLGLQGQG